MRPSLTRNLVVSASVMLVAAITLVLALETSLMYFQPDWIRHRGLADFAAHVVDGMRFDTDDRPVAIELNPHMQVMFDSLPTDVVYQVLDAGGEVLLASNPERTPLLPPDGSIASSPSEFDRLWHGLPVHVITVPVQRPKRTLYVQLARSDRFDAALQQNEWFVGRIAALIATMIALTVFSAVALFTVRRLLKDLGRASQAAAHIDPTNLAARLDVNDVPKEIAPLIESFNAALERLERGFRIQQDFLATAAHELKTPLMLVRGQIELEGTADRATLLKDLDHIARQVHQLLHLAEVSDMRNFSVESMDVGAVIADAVDHQSRLAQARGIEIELELPDEPQTLRADRGAFFVLVRNLVENAVHHSPNGGRVLIQLNGAGLGVRDQGPGISAQDLPMLFKRFWRGAHRRDEGAGLGLSICHEIAEHHGWSIEVESAPGRTVFKVLFARPARI